jgi:hypothetical protein
VILVFAMIQPLLELEPGCQRRLAKRTKRRSIDHLGIALVDLTSPCK